MRAVRQRQTFGRRLDAFLFGQTRVFVRLALVRMTFAATCALLVACGPYDEFFVTTSSFLFAPPAPLGFLPPLGWGLHLLRAAVIVSAVLLLGGWRTRPAAIVLAVTFGYLNFYVAHFGGARWSYNTFLVFVGMLLAVTDCGRCLSIDSLRRADAASAPPRRTAELASYALAFMQVMAATIYLQAGLAKLVGGGGGWYTGGETLLFFAGRLGAPASEWLDQHPAVAPIGTLAAGIVELSFPLALASRTARVAMPILAIAFHLATYVFLGISFWFLWVFFPPLFFMGSTAPPEPGLSDMVHTASLPGGGGLSLMRNPR